MFATPERSWNKPAHPLRHDEEWSVLALGAEELRAERESHGPESGKGRAVETRCLAAALIFNHPTHYYESPTCTTLPNVPRETDIWVYLCFHSSG